MVPQQREVRAKRSNCFELWNRGSTDTHVTSANLVENPSQPQMSIHFLFFWPPFLFASFALLFLLPNPKNLATCLPKSASSSTQPLSTYGRRRSNRSPPSYSGIPMGIRGIICNIAFTAYQCVAHIILLMTGGFRKCYAQDPNSHHQTLFPPLENRKRKHTAQQNSQYQTSAQALPWPC